MLLLSEHDKTLLRVRIEKIISESDLSTITVKGIRKQIEAEDSREYSDEKAFFADTVTACLEKRIQPEKLEITYAQKKQNETDDFKIALKLQQEEEQQSHRINLRRRASGSNRKYQEGLIITPSKNKNAASDENPQKPKRNVLNKPLLLSPEMAAVFDNEFTEMSRPELVKKLWDYIKANNLQDPKDKRFILCDEKLQTVFSRTRINCFKMAKYMSEHVKKIEELSDNISVAKISKAKAETTSQTKSKSSSPKKAKISNEVVDNSDEEAEEFMQEESSSTNMKMNQLLLNVPGVTADMDYSSVQAAILAYTQVKKLRNPEDNDYIILRPGSPISKLMNNQGETSVHLLDLIQRVHFLFDNCNAK